MRHGAPQAEHRVCGDDVGRDDRGNEGEAIRRGGHVAIGKPGFGEPAIGQEPRRFSRLDATAGLCRYHREGRDVLAVENWKARVSETVAIVCRIQFAPEACTPTVDVTESG